MSGSAKETDSCERLETRHRDIKDNPTAADRMQQAVQESPADNPKMCEQRKQLTPLQEDIFKFLLTNKYNKAHSIAKAVKKPRATDVNPDLYKMKTMNLVDHDDSMRWFIKPEENADNDRSSAKKKSTETEVKVKVATQQDQSRTEKEKIINLTEQQAKIYSFLSGENKPQRTLTIAKAMGKTSTRHVNSDLYSLKKLDLVSHNEQEHLWAIKNVSSKEATPTAAEYTMADGPQTTQPLTEENNIQNCPNRIIQQNTNYYIQIFGSQNISIGDNTTTNINKYNISDAENVDPACSTEYKDFVDYANVTKNTASKWEQHEDPNFQHCDNMNSSREYDSGIGNDSILMDLTNSHIPAQEVEQQQDLMFDSNNQNEEGPSNDSSLLLTESDLMHQNPPALTSSPIASTHSMQAFNISDICKGLENVTLDEQENPSTASCSITSVTDPTI